MPTPSPFAQAYASAGAPAPAVPQAGGASAMDALYRAALGPVQLPRYLALFERFDRTGRASAGWNLAASLATLNWMLLHHLWTAALIYLALVEGLALLIFGVGRPLLHWPEQVEWGLIAAFGLFAVALPGLFGDALLHSEIRKRIARALVAAHTIPETCALLSSQASSWRRLTWIAAANVLLFAGIALAWLLVPPGGWGDRDALAAPTASGTVQPATLPQGGSVQADAPTQHQATGVPAASGLSAVSAQSALSARSATSSAAGDPAVAAASALPDSEPAPPAREAAPISATGASASHPEPAKVPDRVPDKVPDKVSDKVSGKVPDKVSGEVPTSTPIAAPPAPTGPTASTAKAATQTAALSTPSAPSVALNTRSTTSPATRIGSAAPAAADAAPASRRPGRPPAAKSDDPLPLAARAPVPSSMAFAPAAPAPAPASSAPASLPSAPAPSTSAAPGPAAPATPVGSAPGYYLNVGFFAEESNARRTQSRLLNANLPAFRQTTRTPSGDRTRVRVGPYATEAEAQKVAAQIRSSLKLEPLMYRQGR